MDWRKSLIFILVITLAGCNLPRSEPTADGVDYLKTMAAKTIDALSTRETARPSVQPLSTATPSAKTGTSPAPTGTASSTPAIKISPTSSGSVVPCDQAAFVRDVTIPDGTLFLPGTKFVKSWEIKNTGSCSWDNGYALVFSGEGESMGGPASQNFVLQGAVPPGEVISVSVQLTAPSLAGEYRGYWRLVNSAGGMFFGANKGIYVDIKVIDFIKQFNLAKNTCNAVWRNSTDLARPALACPGKEGSSNGYVFYTEQPRFFNRDDDEPSFQVEPQQVTDGFIVGAFPPVRIPPKTRLRAFAGCGAKAEKCNARVVITGQPLEGAEVTLKDFTLKPSDDLVLVNVEMEANGLVGRDVIFRFYIRAAGSPTQDKIVFLSPIIELIP